jgi:arylsulfatase A-like enzyme/Tfp pilus assembly protein PilF
MGRKLLVSGALAAAVSGVSCSNPEEGPPNVVLVTIDTLRSDRLGAYGNASGLTPNLDRLAESGVLFENASTVTPLTLPAHASILTGTYPLRHGIRDNGGYYLAPENVTLAEVLSREGYATGAFVAAFVLDSRWGLDQGFDRYGDDFDFSSFDDVSLSSVQRPGDLVLDEALGFMKDAGSRPFFTWIHWYDPHTPYDPPERHRGRDPYDGEVALVDELLGRLVRSLAESDLAHDTILVVTADHGEGLDDHGETEHGFFIYDSTMKVPLIWKAPGSPEGLRLRAQVRSIDLMPTILDELGVEPPADVQGVSLRPLIHSERETLDLVAYGESHYPRAHYGWSELRSLRTEDYHFIDAPRPELYDLRTDPGETENLAPGRPEAARELKRQIEGLIESVYSGSVPPPEPAELDDETRAKLEALGYVGGARRTAREEIASSDLADPKDKIALHELVKAAEADARAGRSSEALDRIEGVLTADPEVVEAHRIQGDLLRQNRDTARAADAYRRALSLDPEYKVAAFQLALLELEAGRLDSAEAGLRRVLEIDPRDNKSYFLLAKLLIAMRNVEGALEVLDRAIEWTSDTAPYHVLKAECFAAQEDFDRADASIRRALELNPNVPRAHFYLGWLSERRGDAAFAIEAYRREIALFPHDPGTFASLAALLRKRGDLAGEIALLEEATSKIPRAAELHVLLGRAYAEAGETARARQSLERGLASRPSPEVDRDARRLLAALDSAR